MTPQELKASILQLAVQGKLVEQRAEEGTGEELYQQIQAEKQRLIETGKIKKEKPLPEIAEDDIPFEIPETWSWTRLSELGQLKNGYAFKSAEYVTAGIQVVRISDLGDDCVESKDAVFYPQKDELFPYIIEDGSFLLCMTGSIGKMAWVRDGVVRYLNQRVGMFIPNKRCDPAYLWYFLHTAHGQLHITTDNDDWRIIVNGNAKKLFLYHKNKYKKREAIPSIVPGYHSQAIHYGTIREYMEYIVGHDKFRKKEAERAVRKANSGKELRKNTYHIQRGTTKQRYNAAQLYSILDDCEF